MKSLVSSFFIILFVFGGANIRLIAQTAVLPASVDVSAIGAATYTIPIDVVPGTGGMQPSLAITYNSHSGISNIGERWSLEGISSITRVPQSIYYDGRVRPVSFDILDRFALDGKRLILLSGTNYHAANAVYGHEVEDFSRITRTWDGINDYFTDTLADGRIAYYGLTPNSRFIVDLDVVAWLLEKVVDGNGNYMTYSYSFIDGEVLLNRIDYTFNDQANMTSYASVQLSYSNIGHANDKYLYGKKLRQYNIIKNINIFYKDELLRHYNLSYGVGINQGKLNMISLYGRDHELLSSTTISWDTALVVSIDGYTGLSSGNTIVAGNFNNDRLYDLFLANSSTFSFRTRNADGTFSSTPVTCQYPNEIVHSTMIACDLDNDGIDEILYSDYPNNFYGYRVFYILHPNVTPNAVLSRDTILYGYNLSQPYIGDFDGDGKLEVVALSDYNNLICYGVNGFPNNTLRSLTNCYTCAATGDFDGDGKTDLMLIRDGDYSIYSYNIELQMWTNIETLSTPNFNTQFQVGDFNGDGLSDILYHTGSSSQWNIAIRKGWSDWAISTVFALDGTYNISTGLPIYNPLVIDINGDGKSDILQTSSDAQMTVLSSLGVFQEAFRYTQQTIVKYPSQKFDNCSLSIGDFDGNGLMDILFNYPTNGNQPTSIKYFYPQNTSLGFVRDITDAFSKKIHFEYSPISLLPSYRHGTDLQWAQFPLVKFLISSDGVGGYDTTFYLYGNAQYDTERNQFIGFANFATRLNNIVSEHYFSKVRRDTINNYTFGYLMPDSVITRYSPIPTSVAISPYSGGTGLWYGPIDTIISQQRYTNMSLSRSSASGSIVFMPYTMTFQETNYLHNTRKYIGQTYSSLNWLPQSRSTIIYDRSINNRTRWINEIFSYTRQNLTNTASIWLPLQTITLSYEGMNTSVFRADTIKNSYSQGILESSIHVDNGGYTDTSRYTYNVCGMPLRISKTVQDGSTRYTDNTYDSTFRFIINQTDFEGNSVHASYDAATGLKTSESDINGITVYFEYDNLGRMTLCHRPNGTSVQYTYQQITGNFPNAVWSMLESEDMRPSKRTYYDMLGRAVHTRIDGQGYRDVVYNHLGQIIRQTIVPYEQISTPDGSKVWQTINYDVYGRLLKKESHYHKTTFAYPPANSYTNTNYQYFVTQREKTGALKTVYYDADNRISKISDDGGSIRYAYDNLYGNGKCIGRTQIVYNNDTTITLLDTRGNLVYISDPDGGTISSTYDGWGQLTQQTDANGNVTTYTYDALGRIATSRTISSGGMGITLPVKYTYYTTNTATSRRIGKLQKISDAFRTYRTFDYDTLGRLVSETNRINNTSYTQSYTYDDYGRLYTITYPSGFVLRHEYDLLGELDILRNHTTGEQIYYIDHFTYLRQPQRAWYGNNTGVEYEYNAYGMPVRLQYGYKIDSSPRSDPGIDSIGGGGIIGPLHPGDPYSVGNEYSRSLYDYDSRGRIISRYDTKCGMTENYSYDILSRLKKVTVNDYCIRSYQYADNGNMTKNGFVGSQAYTYGGDQPHAVTGVTSAEGNISPSQCAVTYNKFNRPASISEGDYTLSLTYQTRPHLDQAILKKNGTAVCTTLYISSISECEKTAYTTRYIDYIYAGSIPVAVHVKNVFLQTDSIYYVQTDLLGSWERIVDADKQVVQASHFDPWGNRMKAAQWHVADTARSFPFRRGFTGHEHYDRFRIINTGARLYDPVIARFFSPDPYVQDPFSTQSFNRYSYCWNNPVMYTDPTGEFVLIDSWLVGFIHGFFSTGKDRLKTAWNTGWRLMRNDFLLHKGMIASDHNKSTDKRIWEIISRNTSQKAQTSLGFSFAQFANLSEGLGIPEGGIKDINYAYGSTVVSFNHGDWGAITLGSYICGGPTLSADYTNTTFQHEFGHYLQSQSLGALYLTSVGEPSITSCKKTHKYTSVEIDANRRAFNYFNQYVIPNDEINYWFISKHPLYYRSIPDLTNDYVEQRNFYIRSFLPISNDIFSLYKNSIGGNMQRPINKSLFDNPKLTLYYYLLPY